MSVGNRRGSPTEPPPPALAWRPACLASRPAEPAPGRYRPRSGNRLSRRALRRDGARLALGPLLTRYGGDVLGDVLDLLVGQLAAELGHHALAVRGSVDHQGVRRLLVVEVRSDGAVRPGIRER